MLQMRCPKENVMNVFLLSTISRSINVIQSFDSDFDLKNLTIFHVTPEFRPIWHGMAFGIIKLILGMFCT